MKRELVGTHLMGASKSAIVVKDQTSEYERDPGKWIHEQLRDVPTDAKVKITIEHDDPKTALDKAEEAINSPYVDPHVQLSMRHIIDHLRKE